MRGVPSQILVLLISSLLAVSHFALAGVVLTAPISVAGIEYTAPEKSWLPTKLNVSGPILFYDRLNYTLCENEATLEACQAQVRGKIVFFSAAGEGINKWNGISFDECFERTWRWGVSGVIYVNNVIPRDPGGGEVLISSRERVSKLIGQTVVEMGYEDGEKLQAILQAANETVYGNLIVGDRNKWREIRLGAPVVVFQAIAGTVAAVVCILATMKLIGFIWMYGFAFAIPQISLTVELAANMVRLIYICIDPIYSGKYLSDKAAHILFSITWPFALINTCLIAMYWHQLVSKANIDIASYMTKMRIPFIIVASLILILEIVTVSLRASHLGGFLSTITTINGALYAISLLALCIFFCVVGGKVIHKLNESSKITGSRRVLRKTTIFVIVSMIFSIFFLASLGIGAITSVFFTPVMNFVACCLLYIGLLGGSLSRVLSFKTPMPGDMPVTALSSRRSSRLLSTASGRISSRNLSAGSVSAASGSATASNSV